MPKLTFLGAILAVAPGCDDATTAASPVDALPVDVGGRTDGASSFDARTPLDAAAIDAAAALDAATLDAATPQDAASLDARLPLDARPPPLDAAPPADGAPSLDAAPPADGAPSLDALAGLDAAPPDAAPLEPSAELILNEVECRGEDWIEVLVTQPGDLAGWRLTDDPLDPERGWTFPNGFAPVAAGSRWVLPSSAGLAVLPFGLACGREALYLVRPDGSEGDVVVLPDLPVGVSYGRLPDGIGGWTQTEPTPGEANRPLPPPSVRFNEVSCRGSDDWVELINVSAEPQDIAGWGLAQAPVAADEAAFRFPPGTVLPAGALYVLRRGDDPRVSFPFGLACADETVYLLGASGLVADAASPGELLAGQTWSRLPDGDGEWSLGDATPGEHNRPATEVVLRLNEIACRGREWVELVSLSARAVDAGGWSVDDDEEGRGFVVPDGTRLDPDGFAVLWQQTRQEDGFHFAVSCGVDSVFLHRPDGTVVDTVAVDEGVPAASWGRLPDANGDWERTEPTPGAPNTPPSPPAPELFDPMHVHRVELFLEPDAIESLRRAPRDEVRAGFRLTLAGEEPEGDPLVVAVRIKGRAGSLRSIDAKPAFKVDVNQFVRDQRVHGLKMLTLNNQVQDVATLHEWLAYRIFRAFGLPAPRTGYAWVTVNGQDYGLYANIETLDDIWLAHHFASTQHLYEGLYGQDLFFEHLNALEIDEGDEDGRDDLAQIVALCEEPPEEGFYAATQDLIDWEQVLGAMATEIYIGHWDGYAPTRNNYRFHFDDDGVLTLLPWGTDQTFDRHLGFEEGRGRMLEQCRTDPDCQLRWARTYAALVERLDALDLDAEIVEIQAQLAPFVEADPRRAYTPEQVAATVQRTRSFLVDRRDEVAMWLDCMLGPDADPDGDGFRCTDDCDNNAPDVHPGAIDVCGDGIDQDCNGRADDGPDCPDCAERRRGPHDYLICLNPRPWAEGEPHCRELGGPTYSMVHIDDASENAWVFQTAMGVAGQNYWLGLNDIESEGDFVWTDGQPQTPDSYDNWNHGEPNNAGNEDCAHFWSRDGTWNDLPCDQRLAVICEARCEAGGEPIDEDGDGFPRCGVACDAGGHCGGDCDDGDPGVSPGAEEVCWDHVDQDCDGVADQSPPCEPCMPIERGSHAYRICIQPLPWVAARQRCVDLGMDLVVVDDALEDAWIHARATELRRQDYWIGVGDAEEEGAFTWVDGRPLHPGAFAHWAPGEPNDGGAGEDCVEIYGDDGAWSDLLCDAPRAALCEAPCGDGGEPVDGDGDGFPRCGVACADDGACGTDCDDSDAATHPGAAEICGDGVDQDCSGAPDDGAPCAGAPP